MTTHTTISTDSSGGPKTPTGRAGTATEQFWVYDEGINAVLEFDGPAAADIAHRYLWQNKVDQLLADEQVTTAGAAGDVLWALTDHLGTIRDIADLDESTGITAIANHRTFDAFGNLTAETDTAINLLYGFTGKQFDEATRLQHNLFRWYDPKLGQWLSEDPIGFKAGDENLRRYVGNQSAGKIDHRGLEEGDYNPGFSEAEERAYLYSVVTKFADLRPENHPQSSVRTCKCSDYGQIYDSMLKYYPDEHSPKETNYIAVLGFSSVGDEMTGHLFIEASYGDHNYLINPLTKK